MENWDHCSKNWLKLNKTYSLIRTWEKNMVDDVIGPRPLSRDQEQKKAISFHRFYFIKLFVSSHFRERSLFIGGEGCYFGQIFSSKISTLPQFLGKKIRPSPDLKFEKLWPSPQFKKMLASVLKCASNLVNTEAQSLKWSNKQKFLLVLKTSHNFSSKITPLLSSKEKPPNLALWPNQPARSASRKKLQLLKRHQGPSKC